MTFNYWLERAMGVDPNAAKNLFIPIIGPDGKPRGLMARDVADALASTAPLPTQSALDGMFLRATRVRYVARRMTGRNTSDDATMVDVTGLDAVASLAATIRIRDADGGHLLTLADHRLELSNGTDVIAEIGVIRSAVLRCVQWRGDAVLREPLAFVDWLAAHGAEQPRRAYQAEQAETARERAENDRNVRRWVEFMPRCLRQFWDQQLWPDNGTTAHPLDPLATELAAAYPDAVNRAAVLLRWYGSGAGPWSGYPCYEESAERLLLLLPTTTLIAAVERHTDDPTTMGAARLFADWTFHKSRPADAALLPVALRHRLAIHAARSGNNDNADRARRAFS